VTDVGGVSDATGGGAPGIDRPVSVMKFGGTSVATAEGRAAIAARVTEQLEMGKAPVVVVSAMGRKGAPYATDTLLGLVDGLPADERESDLLASVGEVISAIVVAHELRGAGIAATALTGAEAGICTDGVAGSSAVTEIHTGPLAAAIAHGLVPVVCGFQGIADDGTLTTLGRGGSDTTACALGVALAAEEVAIYTDVDGVMSADPRTCDGAEVLEVIRADELFQMARHGSRVVHTPAAELALASGMAVRVRNTYSAHPGTVVADIASYRPSSVATAVTQANGVVRISVALAAPEGTAQHMAAQARVYRAMADAGVSLDMFTPVGETLVFSVSKLGLDRACEVLGALGLEHRVTPELAKVTLVGAGMHGVPGVMARMAGVLADAGVTVLQTADSHTTISVLVTQDSAEAAVRALHDGFELGE
jgi:aspartate kinase